MGCETCPLAGTRKVTTKGNQLDGRFLVVVDAPSEASARRGALLSKPAMKLFREQMSSLGFCKDDFAFHGAVQCPHDPDKFTRQEKKAILDSCREYMLETIDAMQPEVIVPMGAEPSRQVLGRAVKITKVRGVYQESEEHGCGVIPFLHPGYVAMYPQHKPTFNVDCKTLARLVDFEYDTQAVEDESLGEYEIIDDLQFLIDANPKVLAFDCETQGLRWYASEGEILTMQFCIAPGKAYLLPWNHPDSEIPRRKKLKLKKQLRKLLQNPDTKVIGHNLKFDAVWVKTHLGFRFRIGGDTLMMLALLDENSQDKSLSTAVKQHVPEMAGYDDRFNAEIDKSNMAAVPLVDIVDYGCGDVDAVLELWYTLRKELRKDKKLFRHYYYVSLPGLNTFVQIDSQGLLVDEDEFENFTEFMEERVEEQRVDLIQQVPKAILRKHAEKGFKFSRADFVRDILFYHKDGYRLRPRVFTKKTAKLDDPKKRLPSTSSKDHLPFFFETCPFTIDLAQHMKDTRLLGTNIKRFKEKYIVDGMVYPRYSLTTAVTGRTSSEDPNGQNFPKRGPNAKAYRRCFMAPPGFVIVAADLSQAELRISAAMSGDKTMIRIYANDGDIHTATACIVMDVSLAEFMKLPDEERDLARFKAKAVNFGFIYGMGWRKFIIYAKTQYGIEFTEAEAQAIRDRFFRTYAALPTWHKRVRKLVGDAGFVRSYDGRVRHLPMVWSDEDFVVQEAERQAINSPVQEFGSSLGVMSMARIDRRVDPAYMKLMAFVHDEISVLVREEHIAWGAQTLKYFMESNPLDKWFNLRMPVPIKSDVGFGYNMGSLVELPNATLDDLSEKDMEKLDWGDIPEQEVPPNNGRIQPLDYMRLCA